LEKRLAGRAPDKDVRLPGLEARRFQDRFRGDIVNITFENGPVPVEAQCATGGRIVVDRNCRIEPGRLEPEI
jgi:hypothetical protein